MVIAAIAAALISRSSESAMQEIRSAALQRLYADWDSRRRGREFPARRDFDPCEMRYILGFLNLVDVLRGPLRFRYRVFGSEIATRLAFEMTGRLVDDYPLPEHRALVQHRYAETIAARRPIVAHHDRRSHDEQLLHQYESLVLPLSSDGTEIDMLMAGFAFAPEQIWTGHAVIFARPGCWPSPAYSQDTTSPPSKLRLVWGSFSDVAAPTREH
jgi:hypothetical protein